MKCTAPRSATTKTTHPRPHPLSLNITTLPPFNSRPPHPAYGLPATMRAYWLGREASRPAYPRKNALPLTDGAPPHDPSYSIRACLPDHSPPRFPLHHRQCTHNPHTPFRPRDRPNVPTHPFTTNQQADSAPPLRHLRRILSPHPSLARTSGLHHRSRRNALPNLP
jgi:hypothetical protein